MGEMPWRSVLPKLSAGYVLLSAGSFFYQGLLSMAAGHGVADATCFAMGFDFLLFTAGAGIRSVESSLCVYGHGAAMQPAASGVSSLYGYMQRLHCYIAGACRIAAVCTCTHAQGTLRVLITSKDYWSY